MGFGRRQDKDNVRRRLFQRLEQGIGCFFGKHVDFVDNVDFIAGLVGSVVDFLPEVSNFINAAVAGGVNLDNVQGGPLGYGLAQGAGIAGFTLAVIKAVHRLGQDTSGTGLTGAPGTAEKVGMRNMAAAQSVQQRLGDLYLADDISQGLGAPSAIKNLGGHLNLLYPSAVLSAKKVIETLTKKPALPFSFLVPSGKAGQPAWVGLITAAMGYLWRYLR